MPLLHRKAFVRQEPPDDLRPDEEVFLCRITHEIFRTYDEFFERTILCNSLVWSCVLTGRAGLTYLEAAESERRARQNLRDFPAALIRPLLHLAALCRRGRLSELCEDVHAFTKERFFPGETVDVSKCNGTRYLCEILEVHSSHSSAKGPSEKVNGQKSTDGDTIVISDSDEEAAAFQSPASKKRKKKPLSPSAFKYEVKSIKDVPGQPFIARANQISRRKNALSRERLKLLLKQHCEPIHGVIRLKESSVAKYRLAEHNFSQFFPDEPPQFPCSVKLEARGGQGAQSSTSHLMAAEEKLKLLQQKEEMAAKSRVKSKEGFQEAKEKSKEEQRRRFEEEKQKRREEKERKKQEKDLEREKLKEEKKKYAERLKLWNKPREDMECEDLKELPTPTPVRTRLPPELFGDAMMVLEFLRAFGEDFGLKDEFPEGVSLEVLEEALVGSDPDGPLCEMLFFFITAIFQALDEEQEEVNTDAPEEASEAPDEDAGERADCGEGAAPSSAAAAWSQLHLGCSLQEVDLDSCTLSEILRLHILASAGDCAHANPKFRRLAPTDDPCVELCSARPALVRRLACTAVYDLTPGEKLSIVQALAGKLLTLASSRDLIEDCLEDQRAARQELREIRAEQHRREREEAAYRVRLRKEERLKEQERRLKMKEGESKDGQIIQDEAKESATTDGAPKDPAGPLATLTVADLEEEQEKVRLLLGRIQKAASCTSLHPLGRDRLYRRYWLLPSASALLVEEDVFGLTEDMLRPRPKAVRDGADVDEDDDDVQEEPAEGCVGSSPAPPQSGAPPLDRPNQWFFYSSVEELDQLLDALNPRGHRESGLKEALLQERERLQEVLQACHWSKYTCTDDPESSRSVPERTATARVLMEVRLRDLLLDLEDRIHQGTLGTLKVAERRAWRSALEAGNYQLLMPAADSGDQSLPVRSLARALSQVEHGIERRFLKSPLVEEESKKESKMKKSKKKDEDQASDDGSDSASKLVLERWRESLLSSSSLSQVFVHLSILERSVQWSRSILNARCRLCRRKGDADSMLLCDLCDRGHHTHCLRPRLKSIPEGDWFCPDCRPKTKSRRLPSRQRSSTDEEDEDESEDEEESTQEEEDEDEEESEEEEEEEERVVASSSKKSQPAPPKGKSQQATPKNVATTNGKSANKSSGKKSNNPPPSSAKSEESPQNCGSGVKRTASRKVKPVLTPPPPSSGANRRSSGRNRGVHQLSALELLVVELVRHDDSWLFMKLVTRTQVPDYYDIISQPIALSTIREKVNNCQYLNTDDFISDVELMFSNCFLYNARHTNEAKAGLRLQQFFRTQLKKLGLSDGGGGMETPPTKRLRH
ncbi:bromodomain adjacent to zinc finger domain protein 1A [Stigmatopora nigra]